MSSSIKIFLCIAVMVMCDASIGSETISLLEIHKLRSSKLNKGRLFYGKKILIRRLSNQSAFIANSAADMANRLGCDQSMQAAAKHVLGKKSSKNNKAVASACEVKSREK